MRKTDDDDIGEISVTLGVSFGDLHDEIFIESVNE